MSHQKSWTISHLQTAYTHNMEIPKKYVKYLVPMKTSLFMPETSFVDINKPEILHTSTFAVTLILKGRGGVNSNFWIEADHKSAILPERRSDFKGTTGTTSLSSSILAQTPLMKRWFCHLVQWQAAHTLLFYGWGGDYFLDIPDIQSS